MIMKHYLSLFLLLLPINVLGQSSANSSTNTDSMLELYVFIAVIVIFLVYKIIKFFHDRKCPFCKKGLALEIVDEENLGRAKTRREKHKDGSYDTIYYYKIKFIKECKYCGGIVNVIKVVRGDS